MKHDRIQYADDDVTPVRKLIRMRIPSLAVGISLGLLLSFITSRFETAISRDVRLAYFIPFVVYVAAAAGAQTQTIYTRDLATGRASFKKYLIKESLLGVVLGATASLATATVTFLWFASLPLTIAVSLSMFATTSTAPLVSLVITEFFQLEHSDPAVGAGPIATIIQDTLSVLIYGFIASSIVLPT